MRKIRKTTKKKPHAALGPNNKYRKHTKMAKNLVGASVHLHLIES